MAEQYFETGNIPTL